MIFRVVIIVSQSLLHYFDIISDNKTLYSKSNKTNGIKIGLQLYNLWQIHGHQLNCKLENPSLLFRHIAQYLGSDGL